MNKQHFKMLKNTIMSYGLWFMNITYKRPSNVKSLVFININSIKRNLKKYTIVKS